MNYAIEQTIYMLYIFRDVEKRKNKRNIKKYASFFYPCLMVTYVQLDSVAMLIVRTYESRTHAQIQITIFITMCKNDLYIYIFYCIKITV